MRREVQEKGQRVYRVAHELYRHEPDWVTFFREVLGLDGIVSKAYPDPDSLQEFQGTAEYVRIQQMLAKLRSRSPVQKIPEVMTVITVRLPKSLHETLKLEAESLRVSMNRLCLDKLRQQLLDESDAQSEASSQDTDECDLEQADRL